MRKTRQTSPAPSAEEGAVTMAQVLEIMRALQDDVAASRMEQERMQADLAASQGRNEELNRVNEELHKTLQAQKERVAEERVAPPPSPPRTFPMPFSSEIMGAVVPPGLVGVKASFTGVEDLVLTGPTVGAKCSCRLTCSAG